MSAIIPEATDLETIDVELLPRWAAVAFAARCARRVYLLLVGTVPDREIETFGWFERAIRAAERSAAAGKPDGDVREAASIVPEGAAGITHYISREASTRPELIPHELLTAVGTAAAYAAWAVLREGSEAADWSFHQARKAALDARSRPTVEAMAREWHYLRALASKEQWTDMTPVAPERVPTPSLRLTGLYVKGLRAIQKFELPRDGLGWGDRVPDLVLLAGVNGSGKTTLLRFITEALQTLTRPLSANFAEAMPKAIDAAEAWVDFEIEAYEIPKTRMRFIVGDDAFYRNNRGDASWGFTRTRDGGGFFQINNNGTIQARQTILDWFAKSTIPSALFFSSEERTLIVPPHEGYKSGGKLTVAPEFVHRWRPPAQWKDSLEAVLYALRWEDLNAKEEGRDNGGGGFEAYADAFRRFTGNAKSLSWDHAELVVRLAESTRHHDLSELSSGEKQVLLLSGEILRHWRPGSLVLIDEPELHLHNIWQNRLYEALRYWQLERGGQVILATQSSHLFGTIEPGTAALLGVDGV